MNIQKIRKDGNSLVVTIPREAARLARLEQGTPVHVYADEATGELHIQAFVPRGKPDFLALGRQIIEEKRDLLVRLANDDDAVDNERSAAPLAIDFRTPPGGLRK
jgi:antitoxin component of MazEF toxin-antitoxin module